MTECQICKKKNILWSEIAKKQSDQSAAAANIDNITLWVVGNMFDHRFLFILIYANHVWSHQSKDWIAVDNVGSLALIVGLCKVGWLNGLAKIYRLVPENNFSSLLQKKREEKDSFKSFYLELSWND